MSYTDLKKATQNKVKTTGVSDFSELELSKVYPNPDQPRKSFENIEELSESIKVHGLVQPIAVVKKDKSYMIISGERRFRAIQGLGYRTIKAHVMNVDDREVKELALIENIQRDDLTPFEKAMYIHTLSSDRSYKPAQLAKALGKSQSYISKSIAVSKLCSAVLWDLRNSATSRRQVGLEVLQELSRVKDEKKQYKLYSSRAKREEIREVCRKEKKEAKGESVSPAKKEDNHYLEVFAYKGARDSPLSFTFTNQDRSPLEGNLNIHGLPAYTSFSVLIKDMSTRDRDLSKIEVDEASEISLLRKEIEELKTKQLYITGYHQKKGSAAGGGHRVRAINNDEAIELAKAFYSNQAKDKNYIFEAQLFSELEKDIKDYRDTRDGKNIQFEYTPTTDTNVLYYFKKREDEAMTKVDLKKAMAYRITPDKKYKITIEET